MNYPRTLHHSREMQREAFVGAADPCTLQTLDACGAICSAGVQLWRAACTALQSGIWVSCSCCWSQVLGKLSVLQEWAVCPGAQGEHTEPGNKTSIFCHVFSSVPYKVWHPANCQRNRFKVVYLWFCIAGNEG